MFHEILGSLEMCKYLPMSEREGRNTIEIQINQDLPRRKYQSYSGMSGCAQLVGSGNIVAYTTRSFWTISCKNYKDEVAALSKLNSQCLYSSPCRLIEKVTARAKRWPALLIPITQSSTSTSGIVTSRVKERRFGTARSEKNTKHPLRKWFSAKKLLQHRMNALLFIWLHLHRYRPPPLHKEPVIPPQVFVKCSHFSDHNTVPVGKWWLIVHFIFKLLGFFFSKLKGARGFSRSYFFFAVKI